MNPTKNDLSTESRQAIAKLLNQRLVDLIDLNLQLKQAHWNVKGPHFIALHELFDETAGSVASFVDDVAERIVALGGIADGTVTSVSENTSLTSYPTNICSGPDHLEATSTAISVAGKLFRAAIDQADELGDADTADLFTGISRSLDKSLWFVEAHLQLDR